MKNKHSFIWTILTKKRLIMVNVFEVFVLLEAEPLEIEADDQRGTRGLVILAELLVLFLLY